MKSSPIKATLDQHANGYRYNQDSFLLADFFRVARKGPIADFCAGAGVVSILIAGENPSQPVVALEINGSMAAMAARNAAIRDIKDYHVVVGDVMSAPRLFKGRPFSAIVSNPPYRRFGQGRLNPDPAKALARHEIRMTLRGLVEAAAGLLTPGGTLSLIMIMERLEEYRHILSVAGFCESRHRPVCHYSHSPAKLFLSEAVLGQESSLVTEPPFILADEKGWSAEYKAVMDKHAR